MNRLAASPGTASSLPTAVPPYEARLAVYYRPEMVLVDPSKRNLSASPTKPGKLMRFLEETPLKDRLDVHADFGPLPDSDLRLAHTAAYVDAFLRGEMPLARSNGLAWSPQFAESVRYTNASLLSAVKAACERPGQIALSPTSGFHHASPGQGDGFCTFSGQVIAALKLYRERGLSGAWIDLDGHYGNSIEDSRGFAPDLDRAIPPGCNVNPGGTHEAYLADLEVCLGEVGARVLRGEIHYVAFAHGADSHEWDDMGGEQCSTDEWLSASRMVYGAVRGWSEKLGRCVPLALSLFGGYRKDDYDSVLSLHAADLSIALETLSGASVGYQPRVSPRGPGAA